MAHHRREFPRLVHYGRFVKWMDRTTLPLFACLIGRCLGRVSGISFIDSTPLAVCSNKRISRHRVFDGLAKLGKSTLGWFHGFKLHLVINDQGELLAFALTPGNMDDRKPTPTLTRKLWGKLFGDKGYLSQALFEQLYEQGVTLITNVRKNMKNRLMAVQDRILLRKRSLIETVHDQLKNVCQIEHTRHRKPQHLGVHLIAGLIAYAKQPKKPTLKFSQAEKAQLAMVD